MAENLSSEQLAEIERIIQSHSGLTLAGTLPDTKERCIRAAIARSQALTVPDFIGRLHAEPALLDELLDDLTIGETYFFRTPAHFELLEKRIFPEIQMRRGTQHIIRVWSAGCASGEEAYSVAMLGERLGLGDQIRIMATDVSRRALAKALAGRFSDWALRDRGSEALPYLHVRGRAYELDAALRRRVTFEYLNLAAGVYPSVPRGIWGMDVIFCRNVLIYFDRSIIPRVAQRLYDTLAPGGWMITAAPDPSLGSYAPFEIVPSTAGILYRRPADHEPATDRSLTWHWSSSASASEPPPNEGDASADQERHLHSADDENALREPLLTADDSPSHGDVSPEASQDERQELAALEEHWRVEIARGAIAEVRSQLDKALRLHPLCAELYYWNAVLLIESGHDREALHAISRALYLDRQFVVAHFMQGLLLQRQGDVRGAVRAFTNVRQLCDGLATEEPIPFSDGQRAGGLRDVAKAQIEVLSAQQVT